MAIKRFLNVLGWVLFCAVVALIGCDVAGVNIPHRNIVSVAAPVALIVVTVLDKWAKSVLG